MQALPLPILLLMAALLEAGGDALLRKALLDSAGLRALPFLRSGRRSFSPMAFSSILRRWNLAS